MRVHRVGVQFWFRDWTGVYLKWLWACYYQLLFKPLKTVYIPDKKLQLAPFNLHDGGFTFRNQLTNFVKKLHFPFIRIGGIFRSTQAWKKALSDLNKHRYPSLCPATGSEGRKIVIGMQCNFRNKLEFCPFKPLGLSSKYENVKVNGICLFTY